MNTLRAVDEVPFSSWILFILHLRPLTVSQCEQYKIFYKRGFISLISIQQIKQSKKKKKKRSWGWRGLALLSGCTCSDFTAQPKLKGEEKKKKKRNKTKASFISGYTQGQHTWTSVTRDYWNLKRGTISTSRFEPFPRDCCEVLSSAGWDLGSGGKGRGFQGRGGSD